MSLDGVPYIGTYSANTPDLYVASGFNKWGMTSANDQWSDSSGWIAHTENEAMPTYGLCTQVERTGTYMGLRVPWVQV